MSFQLRTFAFIDSMQPQAAAHVAATCQGDVPVAGRGKADDKAKDKSKDNVKRVINAEAEITILGPDRMSIRLFRKGSKANARAD